MATIRLAIQMVMVGLSSLRGATRCFQLISEFFEGGSPCHVVIQNWIMRFGLHKLLKPVEWREDWIYLLDHTIDFGVKKCLVVLGVTLEKFRQNQCNLRHQDMEVLAIAIDESATAASVQETLETVSATTGVPVQIVSDNGSNIKRGVEDFLKEKPETKYTYDITHKAGILLKHHLEDDTNWSLLVKKTCETNRSLLHTILGFLAPPKPRDKSRWLNLDSYLDWAEKVLCFGEVNMECIEREKYDSKLAWLHDFKPYLKEWRTMLDMLNAAKDDVKINGLRRESAKRFKKTISGLNTKTKRLQQLKREIIEYLKEESTDIDNTKPWLGCSDIIESIFGKYKNFSAKTPMKEVGRTVLTMPVFTSEISLEEVKVVMENVSTQDVNNWLDQNIGDTLFAKRKRAYNSIN